MALAAGPKVGVIMAEKKQKGNTGMQRFGHVDGL